MRGTRGSNAQRRAGGKRQKMRQGEVWRGPILRLIESSFETAGTSLKNDGVFSRNKNQGRLLFVLHHKKKRKPGECICFIATTEQPSVSPKEAGRTFVIYDNCFLPKTVNILWWLFPEGWGGNRHRAAPTRRFIRWGREIAQAQCIWRRWSERGGIWCQNSCSFTNECVQTGTRASLADFK